MNDLSSTRVGIIGLGNMGSALARGLGSLVTQDRLLGFDRSAERLMSLPVTTADSARDLVDRVDVIILAIKPQQLTELEAQVGSIGDRLLISILAGTPIDRLKRFGTTRIVRAMPNLAALVGNSVTGWMSTPTLTVEDRRLTEQLLGTIGTLVPVDDEALLDAVTAVSGSGPGYLAYLAEAMVVAAQQLGFERTVAESIVRQTIIGSAELFSSDRRSFDEIRSAVSSRGGTTEAAIAVLEEAAVGQALARAITAARVRAEELGRADD